VKYIFAAHAVYPRLNYGTWPIMKADGITCVSGAVLKSMTNWAPARIPIRVIHNPINSKIPPWTGSGSTASKHLLYLGRISEKKGPLFLIEVMARLKNQNWVLDVIGDGPAMNLLREKIEEHGFGERVAIHGFSNEAPVAISRCDLFLFPSREEGLPLALMEALLSGAPILASDIPAARELTSLDGTNPGSELLPPTDAAAWGEAIDRFLDGRFTPKLKLAVNLPTEDETAFATLEFYSEIINL